MAVSIFTIGHAKRSMAELLRCLQDVDVVALIDIRSNPHSPHYLEFNQDTLRAGIEAVGLVYHWAGRHLGGQRTAHLNSQHTALRDASLQAYADHMEKEVFRLSVLQLTKLAQQKCCVLFSGAADPYQSHRSLLSDYLCLQGYQVIHILESCVQQAHCLTPCLCVEAGKLRYEDRQAARH